MKMKIKDKAKQIVEAGFQIDEVFAFFDKTNKDIVDYIAIFGSFGVSSELVWDFYENWQFELLPEEAA
jgi:hypothetical protein